ncbi:uncharacterized protein LOC143305847 [Osmia lignaria lignaria]|uniref:uncharacterized protein LOC143305847 n=1 Tax=Osmia lignaria lignaria TaxID=1437193 RepID=UPI00402B2ACC
MVRSLIKKQNTWNFSLLFYVNVVLRPCTKQYGENSFSYSTIAKQLRKCHEKVEEITENKCCVHLGNRNKEEAIEGDISSPSNDTPSDICTKSLLEFQLSVDDITDDTDVCISGSQINEQNLMEEEWSGRRSCCCK